MASEQREKERLERKLKKSKKKRMIAWIVIGVIVAALLIMRVAEIDFSAVKDGSAFDHGASQDSGFPYQLSSGSDVSFGSVGKDICVLEDTAYTVLDSSDAEVKLNFDHGFANPVLKTAGSYTLLYDQGGLSYRLDSNTENIYQEKTDQQLLCADVSDSGTVALATTSSDALSSVYVFNKSLKQKFAFDVTDGYVTNVAVDSRGSRVAFTAVSSENARFKSTVYTMSVDDAAPRAQFEYVGSSVLDLRFSATDLFIVGSDFVSVIDSLKNEKQVYEQGAVGTVTYSFTSDGKLVYAYTAYSGSVHNTISVVRSSGSVTEVLSTDSAVKDVTGSSSRVSVLTAESVVTYKISNSKVLAEYPVDDSYSAIQQISSDVYARHQAVVERLGSEQG